MISHAPDSYRCLMCAFVAGEYTEHNTSSDLVVERQNVLALVSPKWWPNNPGGVLVLPREHHESIYELPRDVGHALWDLTQDVATAMRHSYNCDGITVRQHNEPAGDQDMWHLHVHVIPRHHGDRLHELSGAASWHAASERAPCTETLRTALTDEA